MNVRSFKKSFKAKLRSTGQYLFSPILAPYNRVFLYLSIVTSLRQTRISHRAHFIFLFDVSLLFDEKIDICVVYIKLIFFGKQQNIENSARPYIFLFLAVFPEVFLFHWIRFKRSDICGRYIAWVID